MRTTTKALRYTRWRWRLCTTTTTTNEPRSSRETRPWVETTKNILYTTPSLRMIIVGGQVRAFAFLRERCFSPYNIRVPTVRTTRRMYNTATMPSNLYPYCISNVHIIYLTNIYASAPGSRIRQKGENTRACVVHCIQNLKIMDYVFLDYYILKKNKRREKNIQVLRYFVRS